jgi:hypothetical protein
MDVALAQELTSLCQRRQAPGKISSPPSWSVLSHLGATSPKLGGPGSFASSTSSSPCDLGQVTNFLSLSSCICKMGSVKPRLCRAVTSDRIGAGTQQTCTRPTLPWMETGWIRAGSEDLPLPLSLSLSLSLCSCAGD